MSKNICHSLLVPSPQGWPKPNPLLPSPRKDASRQGCKRIYAEIEYCSREMPLSHSSCYSSSYCFSSCQNMSNKRRREEVSTYYLRSPLPLPCREDEEGIENPFLFSSPAIPININFPTPVEGGSDTGHTPKITNHTSETPTKNVAEHLSRSPTQTSSSAWLRSQSPVSSLPTIMQNGCNSRANFARSPLFSHVERITVATEAMEQSTVVR